MTKANSLSQIKRRKRLAALNCCVDCTKPTGNKYLNCDKCRIKRRDCTARWNAQIKQKIVRYYGNKCVCCGERNIKFLTIDHKNNDGHLYRKLGTHKTGSNFYMWIVRNNYPETLQLLCYNCNCGRSRNKGICPHEI